MKVSFVILNWNTKDCLVKLFGSLKRFEPSVNYELIVVDQGSADGSAEFLKRLSRRRNNLLVIRNNENKGASYGRNQAVEQATWDYILFCDSNVEFCEENWLEALLLVMEQNPDCGAVGPYSSNASQEQDGIQPNDFCMLVPTEFARFWPWECDTSVILNNDVSIEEEISGKL